MADTSGLTSLSCKVHNKFSCSSLCGTNTFACVLHNIAANCDLMQATLALNKRKAVQQQIKKQAKFAKLDT